MWMSTNLLQVIRVGVDISTSIEWDRFHCKWPGKELTRKAVGGPFISVSDTEELEYAWLTPSLATFS